MNKFLKWLLIVVAALLVIGFAGFQYMKVQTKKASPEETVELQAGDLTINVTYSRPSKKDRQIFGGLVPYGKVWRTGANEATTITFSRDAMFGSTPVKAGTYTLWSIPGPEEWTVILNSKMYGWGVDFDGNAQRDPLADVAQAKVPVGHLIVPVEQFTISLEDAEEGGHQLALAWDAVHVAVPVQ